MLFQLAARPLQKLLHRLHPDNKASFLAPRDTALATRIKAIVQETRRFLEPHWKDLRDPENWNFGKMSKGTCALSSEFLIKALAEQGIAGTYQYGDEDEQQGFRKGNKWKSHAWVTVDDIIVDITADQFGALGVIVTSKDNPRYRGGDHDCAIYRAYISSMVTAWWCGWPNHKLAAELQSGTTTNNLMRLELH